VEDPPVYTAVSDSAGVFALRYLPSGSYELSLYEDVNRNGEVDFAELQGDTLATLGLEPPAADTTILREVTLLRPDTSPPRLIRVEAMDSLRVRLAFDDFLDAEASLEPVELQIAPEEGPGPKIERLLWPRQVDSMRAVADSLAREEERRAMEDSLTVVADSLARILRTMEAAGDTLGADTVGTQLERIEGRIAPPEPREEPEAPREPEAPPPILPKQEFYVLLAEPLAPEVLYQLTVSGVTNLNGLGGGGGQSSFAWEPPEEEPGVEADTAAVVPDTAGVPPDTGRVAPPDTSGAPPDTGRVVEGEEPSPSTPARGGGRAGIHEPRPSPFLRWLPRRRS